MTDTGVDDLRLSQDGRFIRTKGYRLSPSRQEWHTQETKFQQNLYTYLYCKATARLTPSSTSASPSLQDHTVSGDQPCYSRPNHLSVAFPVWEITGYCPLTLEMGITSMNAAPATSCMCGGSSRCIHDISSSTVNEESSFLTMYPRGAGSSSPGL